MKRVFITSALIVVAFGLFRCCDFLDPGYEIDPRLQPYVDNFYQEAAQRGVSLRDDDLKVSLASISQFGRTYFDKVIKINAKVFDSYTESGQKYSEEVEFIIFHELGHALLHLEHTEGIMAKSPAIRAYVGKPEVRKRLLDEMFGLSLVRNRYPASVISSGVE